MKLLGLNCDLATIVLILLIIAIICFFSLCSCSCLINKNKEAFTLTGAPLNWVLGQGVPEDKWSQSPVSSTQADANIYASLANNVGGKVPLPQNEHSFFYNNEFKPECCYKPQQYSSSTGCACISEEQMKYLSSRGGNNTLP